MTPTGTLEDDRQSLILERTFKAPAHDVWASITDSHRLARWFGTWDGDPSTGSVMVTMNAEPEPVPPTRYDIQVCEPPHTLSVSATDEYGHWRLTASLSEVEGVTKLVLRQEELDLKTLSETGPGWEWYLDRLVAAVADEPPPTLGDFETLYMPMSAQYAAMAQ